MSSLFSARWHRVAALRPRLPASLRVRRLWLRGEAWWVLADPASGRSVRLNDAAYAVAARLDGRATMAALWDWQLARPVHDAATQDELIDLLAQLREAGLVQFDRAADFDRLLPHLARIERQAARGSLLAWRFRLGDPTPLLVRLRPLAPWIFGRAGAFAWGLLFTLLVVLLAQHAPALWAHGQRWLATPHYALLAAALYLPIKLLHELSHGLAVLRWGGSVPSAGVTLMLGLPVPWVDASAASAFVRRRERVIVGAAGMMAELALAAVALPLWLWLDDGLARDAAFVTLLVAGISSLVFNANPLQRLDGYYIATDLLDLPNLGPRSRQWWLATLQRRVLRLPGVEPMPLARGEAPWLAAYAPLAWCWGLVIAAFALAWLAALSAVLALLAAVVLGWQLVLRPPWRMGRELHRAAMSQQRSAARWRRLALGGAGAALALAFLPLPQGTLVRGVVWPAEQAQLRAEEAGFVETLVVGDGDAVRRGDPVLRLSNPALQAALARREARVAVLETELFDALPGRGDTRAADLQAELTAARAELARLHERREALTLRAGSDGRVALPAAADLAGRYLERGALVGQVLDGAPPVVRVALPESLAHRLRTAAPAAAVRLAAQPGLAHAASLVREGGGAVAELPSAALSTRHGGDIATDPADRSDRRPLQPVVLLDLQLDAAAAADATRLGERAWVRFDAGLAPLAAQALQALRLRLMQQAHPQV